MKQPPPSADVVRKNLSFSAAISGGKSSKGGASAGADILGSIMMGMQQNNVQKKD